MAQSFLYFDSLPWPVKANIAQNLDYCSYIRLRRCSKQVFNELSGLKGQFSMNIYMMIYQQGFVRIQLEKDGELIDLEELKPVVKLFTSKIRIFGNLGTDTDRFVDLLKKYHVKAGKVSIRAPFNASDLSFIPVIELTKAKELVCLSAASSLLFSYPVIQNLEKLYCSPVNCDVDALLRLKAKELNLGGAGYTVHHIRAIIEQLSSGERDKNCDITFKFPPHLPPLDKNEIIDGLASILWTHETHADSLITKVCDEEDGFPEQMPNLYIFHLQSDMRVFFNLLISKNMVKIRLGEDIYDNFKNFLSPSMYALNFGV